MVSVILMTSTERLKVKLQTYGSIFLISGLKIELILKNENPLDSYPVSAEPFRSAFQQHANQAL